MGCVKAHDETNEQELWLGSVLGADDGTAFEMSEAGVGTGTRASTAVLLAGTVLQGAEFSLPITKTITNAMSQWSQSEWKKHNALELDASESVLASRSHGSFGIEEDSSSALERITWYFGEKSVP